MTAGSAAAGGPDESVPQEPVPQEPVPQEPGAGGPVFDRHLVLDSLGGWRGMVDASLPTVAFIVANALGGLRTGIWSALAAAVAVFGWRLLRRESVQQAVSGLFGVAVAVAIAAASGQARDFFVVGIVRNAAVGSVLLGSVLVRWPLIGVIAEFLAPSHLGSMAAHSLPLLRNRIDRARATLQHRAAPDPGAVARAPDPGAVARAPDPGAGARAPDPAPERHWREDPRMLRAYSWLTVMWGATFLLRVAVQGLLYQRNEVELLGTASLLLGLPVSAAEIVLTLWVVARLHRHRTGPAGSGEEPGRRERPAA